MATLSETLDYISRNLDWITICVIIVFFSIISMRYFRNKETQDKEPIILLIFAVGFGVLSVIPSVILSILMAFVVPDTYVPVIVAPIAEEIGKALFVVIIAKTRFISDPMDGLVYGAMVGTGFSAVENFLYATNALASSGVVLGLSVVSFRSAFQVIGHPLYTGITGYGVGLYKAGWSNSRYNKLWLAMLLHALWNSTTVFYQDYWLLSLFGVIILSIIVMRFITKRAQHLDE